VNPERAIRRARRGFTLIETLVVVTGVAMMIGACALMLQLVVRLNASTQDRFRAAVSLDRLARQLRDDVHRCGRALMVPAETTPGKPAGLHLVIEPDHLIEYEVRPSNVVRNESRRGKMVRHESFFLQRGRAAHFEDRKRGSVRLVAFVVTQLPGRSGTDPPRPLEIVAAPGKHPNVPSQNKGGPP
jgi:hypothetical protein